MSYVRVVLNLFSIFECIIEGPDQRMGRVLQNAEKYRRRCDVTRENSKSENKK